MVEDFEETEMLDEDDEVESGMDNLEEEDKVAKAKPKRKLGKKAQAEAEEEVPQETWEPFQQEAALGIRNTVTGAVIPGFQDAGTVQAMAIVLNMQEKINSALS